MMPRVQGGAANVQGGCGAAYCFAEHVTPAIDYFRVGYGEASIPVPAHTRQNQREKIPLSVLCVPRMRYLAFDFAAGLPTRSRIAAV
eukprot:3499697-Rhodomonas_salina.2